MTVDGEAAGLGAATAKPTEAEARRRVKNCILAMRSIRFSFTLLMRFNLYVFAVAKRSSRVGEGGNASLLIPRSLRNMYIHT